MTHIRKAYFLKFNAKCFKPNFIFAKPIFNGSVIRVRLSGYASGAREGAGSASVALPDVAIEDTLKVQTIFRLFFVCLMQAVP